MLAMGVAGMALIFAIHSIWRSRNRATFHVTPNRVGWLQPLLLLLSLALFSIAAAGPRWGGQESVAVAGGQDIVAVVDVSRSMMARDAMPDRIVRATELLQQFVEQLNRRGGCRVAIIAFASQSHLVCPLTFDLGHVAQKVNTLTPAALPEAFAASAVSGTRIGAALTQAAVLLKESRAGQILLLSDGDDPARDGEWRRGLKIGTPIHVIGLGNPERDIAIPSIDGATTRLQEGPLRELADQTGGHYIADNNAIIDGGGLLNRMLIGSIQADSGLVVSRAQAKPAPFLIAGLLCLSLGLTGFRWRATLTTTTAFTIAASPIDDWLRRGNTELAAGRAESALIWYAKAAERTPDPGQVAFNQGIALAALCRFREAELHFRRSLSDAEGERRAKALFNLGTCLVRRCGGIERTALRDAVTALQQALPLAHGELANEVITNLQVAEKLLAQAPPESAGKPPTPETIGDKSPKAGDRDGGESSDKANVTSEPGKSRRPVESKESARDTKPAPPPGKGKLPPLPDKVEVATIPPEDLAMHLEKIEQRIAAAKQERMKAKVMKPNPNYPDW